VIAREVRYGVGYGGACSIESLLMSPDLRKSDECDIGFMKKEPPRRTASQTWWRESSNQ
jgi:hypothetical protein